MRHRVLLATAIPFAMNLTGCRTANPGSENVKLVQTVPADCKNLGEVNIDWAWWGASSEVLNVLKNQTQAKGGDTLSLSTGTIGHAYDCRQASQQKIIVPN